MRTSLIVLAGLAIALPLMASPAHAATSATVTLRVGPAGFVVPNHFLLGTPALWLVDTCAFDTLNVSPGVACCTVTAFDGNDNGRVDGIEVLSVAAVTDCISGWSASDFGFGLFVTSVDGLDQVGWPVSWWFLHVNGFASEVGISDLSLGTGDSLEFVYEPGP